MGGYFQNRRMSVAFDIGFGSNKPLLRMPQIAIIFSCLNLIIPLLSPNYI